MSSQLESLQNEFNSLISQYQTTYSNYINTINTNTLMTVPNSAFASPTTISVISGSSLDSCTTDCSANVSCSGATFNTTLSNCTLSSGNGNIISSTESTAIVQQAMYYSYQLKQLNQQLLEINKQMMNIAKQNYNNFQENQTQTQNQSTTINYNYNILKNEKIEIEKMIRQFETLNSAYDNGNINITSNYYTYILLLLFVIILVFVLLTFSLPNQKGGSSKHKSNTTRNNIFQSFDLLNFFGSIFEFITLPLKFFI
jgi:hypothetical protein